MECVQHRFQLQPKLACLSWDLRQSDLSSQGRRQRRGRWQEHTAGLGTLHPSRAQTPAFVCVCQLCIMHSQQQTRADRSSGWPAAWCGQELQSESSQCELSGAASAKDSTESCIQEDHQSRIAVAWTAGHHNGREAPVNRPGSVRARRAAVSARTTGCG